MTLAASAALLAALYGDTPNATHAWAVHDWNRPKPAKVEVDAKGVPSDAVVLFDGTKESLDRNWCDEKGQPTKWTVRDGAFESIAGWGLGSIRTREEFGDCQLHIEFRHDPAKLFSDRGPQMRGNSGVFLMGAGYGYEIQVLESYFTSSDLDGKDGFVDNYADGQAGSVYAENPPMVNPQNRPGEWQTYDIVFHQPAWKDGKLVHPGSVTVLFNGVLVQDAWEMEGQTTHCRRRPLQPHPTTGPLLLQDHGCQVAFRNVWIRRIPSRWANLTHSDMSADPKEVAKLRSETAARLYAKIADPKKADAATLKALAEVVSYDDSGVYAKDFRACLEAYRADRGDEKEVEGVNGQLDVLVRNKVISEDLKIK